MSNQTTEQPKQCSSTKQKEPGFFGRIMQKLDNSMKQKAEEKSQKSSCCGGNDKGGKCC